MKVATVLLVDDNLDLGEGLRMVLEDEGHDVTLAVYGSEAISLSREKRFDITFMDMKLPDMTGIEVLMEIMKFNPDPRVVMMSGYRLDELLGDTIDLRAISVLAKPFSIEQMLAEINRD